MAEGALKVGAWIKLRSGLGSRVWILLISLALTIGLFLQSEAPRRFVLGFLELAKASSIQKVASALDLTPLHLLPITIIDIDQTAWDSWGRPQITPRDQLAKVLDRAAQGQAAAVVLDVDLSRPAAPTADAELRRAMENLHRRKIPLLVPREMYRVAGQKRERTTPFDGQPGLVWTTSRFSAEGGDQINGQVYREFVCGDGATTGRPSPQLFIAAIVKDPINGADRLNTALRAEAARRCERFSKAGRPPINLQDTVPLRLAFDDPGAQVSSLKIPDGQGHQTPAVFRWPILRVLDHGLEAQRRIVVIGASHADSDDIHMTEYGLMPGMSVLANAIALGPDMFSHTPFAPWLKWLVVACAAFASAYLFARLVFPLFAVCAFVLMLGLYVALTMVSGPVNAAALTALSLQLLVCCVAVESVAEVLVKLAKGRKAKALLRDPS